MKIVSILLLVIISSSCSSLNEKEYDFEIRGDLFAYFKITEAALSGPVRNETGYFFYKENGKNVSGPILHIYQFREGKVIDHLSTGSISAEVFEDIRQIDLKPFDYAEEINSAEERMKKIGGLQPFWVTADGLEWEIMITTSSGQIKFSVWNPGSDLRNYSKHSDNLAKLEKTIRRLLSYYGEASVGIL